MVAGPIDEVPLTLILSMIRFNHDRIMIEDILDRGDQPGWLRDAIGIVPAPARGLSLRLSICFR
jgi:hypothetical protein